MGHGAAPNPQLQTLNPEPGMQATDEPRVAWISEQLGALAVSDGPAAVGVTVGTQVLAKFSLDNAW